MIKSNLSCRWMNHTSFYWSVSCLNQHWHNASPDLKKTIFNFFTSCLLLQKSSVVKVQSAHKPVLKVLLKCNIPRQKILERQKFLRLGVSRRTDKLPTQVFGRRFCWKNEICSNLNVTTAAIKLRQSVSDSCSETKSFKANRSRSVGGRLRLIGGRSSVTKVETWKWRKFKLKKNIFR